MSCYQSIGGLQDAGGRTAPLSLHEEAVKSAQNLVALQTMFGENASRTGGQRILDSDFAYFANMSIADVAGKPIHFSDFTSEERAVFFDVWVRDTAILVEKNIGEENVDMLKDLASKNAALETALQDSKASASRGIVPSYADIQQMYSERYRDLNSKSNKETVKVPGASSRAVYNVNANSVAALKGMYKGGRPLVSGSGGSSSGGELVGHSAMAAYTSWNYNWDANRAAKTTVGSWWSPCAWFDGGVDGVQYEPLYVWCGTGSNAPKTASIYQAGNGVYIWDWFGSHWTLQEASNSEYESARSFAVDQKGLPYGNVFWKWDTGKYVCSALVWRAWYQVSTNYDMDANYVDSWVWPNDIATSLDVSRIVTWTNY